MGGQIALENHTVVYKGAELMHSDVCAKVVVGDFSRVHSCQLGKQVRIDRNNFIRRSIVGDYTYTGPFDMIFDAEIGKYTSISYGVTIGPPEHNYLRASMHPFIYEKRYHLLDNAELLENDKFDKKCVIGNDVWIGCNSTILRGVSIGDGAVIGANALVNKDIPPYAIAVGNPARIIKYRFNANIIEKLLEIRWWNWTERKIRSNAAFFSHKLTEETLNNIA